MDNHAVNKIISLKQKIECNKIFKGNNMEYDPIKDKIHACIKRYPILRKAFFSALDMLILRQWYVKNEIRKCFNLDSEFTFLDAGAGYCQYSHFVLSKYKKAKVTAIDLKQDYLKEFYNYACRLFPGRFEFLIMDLEKFKSDQKSDLIIAIDILEHIENDRTVIDNFFQSLKLNGKLIISTPSDYDNTAMFTEEHVRNGYSKSEIYLKLEKAGFRIIDFQYSYGFWGKKGWFLSIKLPIIIVRFTSVFFTLIPLYYLLMYPLIFFLMVLDKQGKNKTGNGIIVIAEKSVTSF